jgi:pyruvate formate lyase activating enzyme
VTAERVITRLAHFAPALRALKGGLTISGGEVLVQTAFTARILSGAKSLGLHTAIETSGFLGARATDDYLRHLDLVILDIKSGIPETYRQVTKRELAPTLQFAQRLSAMNKPVWVRFTLVPGLTDDPANVDAVANFVAPMKNVEWVEVLPFHQLGAFKWKALNLEYTLANTPPAPPELVTRVVGQFRAAGCPCR